jgi:hypothetical protein
VSTDYGDLTEPQDPALDGLFRALTADGTADEMAGRAAALETFRAHAGRPPRRHPRRFQTRGRRLAVSLSSAAAALVLTGGIASAYAAALPAPVQHIAYRMLGRIGVPDTHRPAPSASGPAPGASAAPAPSASATAACPCPATGQPGAGSAPDLVLVAARTQVPTGGRDVLSGRLAPGGRPEAGVRVRLLERVAGHPGGRVAGSAVTNASGAVTLTVAHLDSNAWFRLTARGGVASVPVLITVIPPVSLHLAPGPRPGIDTLTARAPSAGTGDVVVLQERAGGVWYDVGRRVLGSGHLTSFSVLVPASGQVAYRVVLPRTAEHGRSVSVPVRVGARSSRAKPGRRAPS